MPNELSPEVDPISPRPYIQDTSEGPILPPDLEEELEHAVDQTVYSPATEETDTSTEKAGIFDS